MSLRRKSREMALQALYQSEMSGVFGVESFTLFCGNFEKNKLAVPYARHLYVGVWGNLRQIDEVLAQHSQNWRLSRMSVIDRNLLRLAVFEMRFAREAPGSVVINEAIEIARRFSTDEATSFINGILDSVSRECAASSGESS